MNSLNSLRGSTWISPALVVTIKINRPGVEANTKNARGQRLLLRRRESLWSLKTLARQITEKILLSILSREVQSITSHLWVTGIDQRWFCMRMVRKRILRFSSWTCLQCGSGATGSEGQMMVKASKMIESRRSGGGAAVPLPLHSIKNYYSSQWNIDCKANFII